MSREKLTKGQERAEKLMGRLDDPKKLAESLAKKDKPFEINYCRKAGDHFGGFNMLHQCVRILHYGIASTRKNALKSLSLLCDHGADVNTLTSDGRSALVIVASNQARFPTPEGSEGLKLLLDRGASVNPRGCHVEGPAGSMSELAPHKTEPLFAIVKVFCDIVSPLCDAELIRTFIDRGAPCTYTYLNAAHGLVSILDAPISCGKLQLVTELLKYTKDYNLREYVSISPEMIQLMHTHHSGFMAKSGHQLLMQTSSSAVVEVLLKNGVLDTVPDKEEDRQTLGVSALSKILGNGKEPYDKDKQCIVKAILEQGILLPMEFRKPPYDKQIARDADEIGRRLVREDVERARVIGHATRISYFPLIELINAYARPVVGATVATSVPPAAAAAAAVAGGVDGARKDINRDIVIAVIVKLMPQEDKGKKDSIRKALDHCLNPGNSKAVMASNPAITPYIIESVLSSLITQNKINPRELTGRGDTKEAINPADEARILLKKFAVLDKIQELQSAGKSR